MRKFIGAIAVALTLFVVGAVPAHAEAPSPSVSSNVTDKTGKLDKSRMELLVNQVQAETDYELYVYLTDSLDGMSGAQWAVETANKSNLDATNAILFVIATEDRKYGSAFPTGSSIASVITTVEAAAIPAMKDGNWNGAVEAYGNKVMTASHEVATPVAQRSEVVDNATAGFLNVLGFVLLVLVSVFGVGLTIAFGIRYGSRFVEYRRSVKTTKREIAKMTASLPATVTAVDTKLNDLATKISFAESMYGADSVAHAHSAATKASTTLQNAIVLMGQLENTKDRDENLRTLRDAAAQLNVANRSVNSAEETINDLNADHDALVAKVASLKASASEYETLATEYTEAYREMVTRFDASYISDIADAIDALKKGGAVLSEKIERVSGMSVLSEAKVLVSEAVAAVETLRNVKTWAVKEMRKIENFDATRNEVIMNATAFLEQNSGGANAHKKVAPLVAKAKASIENVRKIDGTKGDPDKQLQKAMDDFEIYRASVKSVKSMAVKVSSTKKILISLIEQKVYENLTIAKNIERYGIRLNAAEKEAFDADRKNTALSCRDLEAKVRAVDAYDVDSVEELSKQVNRLIGDSAKKTSSIVHRIEKVKAEQEATQRRIEEENRRKRAAKIKAEEEERRRRNRSRSSSSRSSSSSYSGSSSYYDSGYSSSSSSSSFSGSGGSSSDSGSGGSF